MSKLIYSTTEDKKEIFNMKNSVEANLINKCVGEAFVVAEACIFREENEGEEPYNILSIKTDEGKIYSTISETFISQIEDLDELGILKGSNITITSGKSKNNREFYGLKLN